MILLDTHVLVWAAEDRHDLGSNSRELILAEQAASDGVVGISAITPWEIAMLVDKGRLKLGRDLHDWMNITLSQSNVRVIAIEPAIGIDAGTLPGRIHGDPADRILIATARSLDCPLLTMDRKILDYAEQGHVRVIRADH